MIALIMGLAAAFNVLIILKKIRLKRYEDAIIDAGILALLSWVFGGTLGGMMIATVASAVVSLSLLVTPPMFNFDDEEDEDIEAEIVKSKPSFIEG